MRGLPRNVKSLLDKARDSALLAVEVYNKPAVKFKAGGYVCLMIIAWTALFHAIFFKRKVKPYYKQRNSLRYEMIDDDYKHWELGTCLEKYYYLDTQNPVKKNLDFFIPLRNKIEHRSVPEIDASIFGECQAMLFNFDEMLEKEFGGKYCLRESLSFSLQLFPSAQNLVDAIKQNTKNKPIAEFIKKYRSSVSSEIINSGKYSFKAFLIQVANHDGENTLPIQFANFDKLSEEQKATVEKMVAMVKFKEPIVANANTIKPSEVCKRVQEAFKNPQIPRNKGKMIDKYNQNWHTACFRYYEVRPPKNSENPEKTDLKYCIYDERHNDYSYTGAWVKFLIREMNIPGKYKTILVQDKNVPAFLK
ncbi:MAG: DUF3644 domain-containing protein [Victivallaceae bacterium]|jgi:hypothetical protein